MFNQSFKVAVILGVVLLSIIGVKVFTVGSWGSDPGTVGRYQITASGDGRVFVLDTATSNVYMMGKEEYREQGESVVWVPVGKGLK